MVQQNASSAPGGHTTLHADTMLQRESSSYTHQNVPMPPPDQMYDSVTPALPALNKHPSRKMGACDIYVISIILTPNQPNFLLNFILSAITQCPYP